MEWSLHKREEAEPPPPPPNVNPSSRSLWPPSCCRKPQIRRCAPGPREGPLLPERVLLPLSFLHPRFPLSDDQAFRPLVGFPGSSGRRCSLLTAVPGVTEAVTGAWRAARRRVQWLAGVVSIQLSPGGGGQPAFESQPAWLEHLSLCSQSLSPPWSPSKSLLGCLGGTGQGRTAMQSDLKTELRIWGDDSQSLSPCCF